MLNPIFMLILILVMIYDLSDDSDLLVDLDVLLILMFIDLKADYLDVVLNLNVDHDDDNVHNAKSFHHIEGFCSEKKNDGRA